MISDYNNLTCVMLSKTILSCTSCVDNCRKISLINLKLSQNVVKESKINANNRIARNMLLAYCDRLRVLQQVTVSFRSVPRCIQSVERADAR